MSRKVSVVVEVPDPPVNLSQFDLAQAGGCVVNLSEVLLISPYRVVFKNGSIASLHEGGCADFSELLAGCLGR
jgi:hypothetical protein